MNFHNCFGSSCFERNLQDNFSENFPKFCVKINEGHYFAKVIIAMIENQSTLWTILPKAKRSFTFLFKLQLIDPIFMFHLYFVQGKLQMPLTLSGRREYFLYTVTEGIATIHSDVSNEILVDRTYIKRL